jgi:hypothetical protein
MEQDMRVTFTKQVHGCFASFSTLDYDLQRKVFLPFPPFVGLEVWDRRTDFSAVVEHVSIELSTQVIECRTAADKELYEAQLHRDDANLDPPRPVEEVVQEYLDAGWEIRRAPRGSKWAGTED